MIRMRAVIAAIVIVLGVEIVMVTMGRVSTHVLPGGITLFGVLGAVALVRLAKLLAGLGVQHAAQDPGDD
jgi:hypothetical protein